ncbi:hypothetical protein ACFOLJ_18520 [Rugamonas sp. CCM 8940]|uniref:hypothetical protein n=1 Tax=Rugamonas sp. CCM 8940 TaxID=2765359 RepID=UPI0018F7B635|nr:hypothetical protein [Rugamonas sp. CCM 8940]MBJ7310814.1 hypothetical protein [Rugamonas sp. CCM 8940]
MTKSAQFLLALACAGLAACGGGYDAGPAAGLPASTAPGTPSALTAGKSIILNAGQTVMVPAGTVVRGTNNTVITVNGHLNTVRTTPGATVTVPADASGAADNTVIAG